VTYVPLAECTWPEVEALGRQRVLGLIPTGAIEQHGPHLPLATDCLIAAELARLIADAFVEPVLVAPVVPGGLSDHHLAFPGTVTFTEDAFGAVLTAYVDAFTRIGIGDVAIFSGHGGNLGFLGRYADAHASRGSTTRVIAASDLAPYVAAMFDGARGAGVEPPETDVHAGAVETSQGLALFPGLVRPVYAETVGYTAAEDGWIDRLLADGIHTVTPNGAMGDPSAAKAEAGDPINAAIADHLAQWIADELGYTRVAAGSVASP
jgi:creatinine amidohydrolase